MFKIKTKRKVSEMLLGFIALTAVSYLFYYNKFYKAKSAYVVETTASNEALKTEVESNEKLLAELKVRVGNLVKSQEGMQPDKPTRFLSDLIGEINLKESGVRVNKFTTHELPVNTSIQAINVDLEVESTFIDLATLVERLEDKYKFLEFKKLEITKVDDFLQKSKTAVSFSIYLNKERI